MDKPWWGLLLLALLYLGPALVCCVAFPIGWLHWRMTVRMTGTHLEVWRGPFKDPWFSNKVGLNKVRYKLDKIKTLKQVRVDDLHKWALVNDKRTVFSSRSMPELRKIASAPGMYCGPHALHVTDTEGSSFNVGASEPDVLASVLMKARPGITLEKPEPSGSN